jgi:hypothetical protein
MRGWIAVTVMGTAVTAAGWIETTLGCAQQALRLLHLEQAQRIQHLQLEAHGMSSNSSSRRRRRAACSSGLRKTSMLALVG